MLKLVCGEPALIHNKTLVVADLHLGIENEFAARGIRIGSLTDSTKEGIISLARAFRARRILLLGDVKHNVPNISWQEYTELPGFFAALQRIAEVEVVPGNHDGGLERSTNARIHPSSGFIEGNVAFAHGHAWPSEEAMRADYLVLAHSHPAIELIDKMGYRSIEKVWVVGGIGKTARERYPNANLKMKVIIMPAFNELVGGAVLNRARGAREGLLGPLLKNEIFKLDDAQVFLLSGVPLGKIRDLRKNL
ncbi:MAG: metallophosphoesterase [Candidatus Micrarchaeota archaeon]